MWKWKLNKPFPPMRVWFLTRREPSNASARLPCEETFQGFACSRHRSYQRDVLFLPVLDALPRPVPWPLCLLILELQSFSQSSIS